MTVFAAAGLAVLLAAFVPALIRITVSPGTSLFTVHYLLFPLYRAPLLRALRGYGPALRGNLGFLRCRRFRLRLRFSGGEAAETALLHGWLCGALAALTPLAAPCTPEIALEPVFSPRRELAAECDIALHLPLPVLLFRILPRPRRGFTRSNRGATARRAVAPPLSETLGGSDPGRGAASRKASEDKEKAGVRSQSI
jgi:hypothetical protein